MRVNPELASSMLGGRVPDVRLVRAPSKSVRYDKDGCVVLSHCLSLDILSVRPLSKRVGVMHEIEADGTAVVGPEERARVGDLVDEREVADGRVDRLEVSCVEPPVGSRERQRRSDQTQSSRSERRENQFGLEMSRPQFWLDQGSDPDSLRNN